MKKRMMGWATLVTMWASLWNWVRDDRLTFMLALAATAGAAYWVQDEIELASESAYRRELQLAHFATLQARAARAPLGSEKAVAAAIDAQLAAQDWYENLPGVRPRVVSTPAGLVIRLLPIEAAVESPQKESPR